MIARASRRRLRFAAALSLAFAACDHAAPPPLPPPAIAVSAAAIVVPEGAVAWFEATLVARPAAPVDVEVRSGDPARGLVLPPGYAVPGTVRELTFTPEDWDVPRRISVFGTQDRTVRPNTPYDVTLRVVQAPDPALTAASPATVRVTNPDDDVPGFTVSRHALVTSEVGTRASFDVRLDARPAGWVDVAIGGVDPAEGTLDGWSWVVTDYTDPDTVQTFTMTRTGISFNPGDWDVAQTVTVIGLDDGLPDGERSYTLTLGPVSFLYEDWRALESGDPVARAVTAAWVALPTQQVVVTNREFALDEGTTDAPIEVGPDETRWAEVGTGASHYAVRGAEGVVVVTLSRATGDVSLEVDGDNDFSAGVLCTSDAPGPDAAERCEVAAPPDGNLRLRVSGPGTARGAAFLLAIEDWLPSADAPKAIVPTGYPDLTPTVSTLTASSGPWSIGKVRVRLDLSIVRPTSSASVTLVSPGGTRVELADSWSEGSFAGTIFDDAATQHLYQGMPPYTGTFKPVGTGLITDPYHAAPLSALIGESGRGTWRLEVVHFDAGATLHGWSLDVR